MSTAKADEATPPATPRRILDGERLHRLAGPLLLFALALAVFVPLFQHLPVLYDTDSYYHLAIARAYARHGIIDSLPWAQLSLLHDFGDKEVLFHLLLAPFADGANATAGGRLALALFNALLVAALAFFGQRLAGRWGLLAPLLVYAGSLAFLGRVIRLRPELLSLLLLLAAIACAAERRWRLLALVSLAYTLAYTAFHALLGLCGLWFLARWLWRRRRDVELVLYPLLGCGLGLVLHPHFPQNLVVWKVQSLDFFLEKGALNVGREIGPQSTADFLIENAAWWLAILALAASRRRWPPKKDPDSESSARNVALGGRQRLDDMADALWIATAVFGGLYLLMQRFSLYFVPLATLAVLAELRRRGLAPGRVTLPGGGRLPLAIPLALALLLGMPRTVELLRDLGRGESSLSREEEWHAFGRALPPGARVAAEWGSTHLYMFWAPQAMFLNVLDPVFMATPHPEAYRALRQVFEDRQPDLPLSLRRDLRSDHLALSRFHQPAELLRRLAGGDPRIEPVFRGYTLLYRLRDNANQDFVLSWYEVPAGSQLPPSPDGALSPHPRPDDPALRALEGYVDLGTGGEECQALVHRFSVDSAEQRLYELAPWGPTRLWLDDRLVLAQEDTPRAVLGFGTAFPLELSAGEHQITVLTCPGRDTTARRGFYLLRRG